MKTCFRCGASKPLAEFYAHPQMGDGHLNKCKVCTRDDVRNNYRLRREQYLNYERRRYSPARVANILASKGRHPERNRARVSLHNAVARGKIEKQPCEVCGERKVDGHHDDYSKPLQVRWLCRRHHMERHRMEAPF